MALLTLKDIGKIYVSEGNVAVGIRGVNLSFDRGEFVAVTGKSGSGKSTLLNVISGMDSYEEGELFIQGQSTSHFMQFEWEEYRERYISFIFQDYNIIESFTVLQNVELALMHIEDKKERRARAMELLERVGLTSHIRQKGSKLSGGQKQRTVIARALAKDSPIILADEPTGNLDSATSAEIIELLREVSRDRLLIVVTHNFAEVEACATRHIRVFDGAIESDHVLTPPAASAQQPAACAHSPERTGRSKRKADLKNGWTLGRTIFAAKPRLSAFLCLLMIVGTLGIFLVTAFCGQAATLFDEYYMFEPLPGRVVITRRNGEVIGAQELDTLVSTYGATSALRYDVLLDQGQYNSVFYYDHTADTYAFTNLQCTWGESFGEDILGRYPTDADEVFLYLPISYQPIFGKETILTQHIEINSTRLSVCGVKYYYDNNQRGKCLFSKEGFRVATAVHYLVTNGSQSITVNLSSPDGEISETYRYGGFSPSFELEQGKIYIGADDFRKAQSSLAGREYTTAVNFSIKYYNYNYYYDVAVSGNYAFEKSFTDEYLTDVDPGLPDDHGFYYGNTDLVVHPSLLVDMAEDVLSRSYRQASLFFADDAAAHRAAEQLSAAGYMAVPADTTYTPDAFTTIVSIFGAVAMAFLWVLAIFFLAFFLRLCSNRALGAFKGDMAIMRSMGIPVKVIRVGMYVRMLMSLLPAILMVIVVAILIFTSPRFNGYFTYLYAWQYALIFLGMLLLTLRITHTQLRRLFGQSVKKSLKGGDSE